MALDVIRGVVFALAATVGRRGGGVGLVTGVTGRGCHENGVFHVKVLYAQLLRILLTDDCGPMTHLLKNCLAWMTQYLPIVLFR